jgi:hypothetical protein
MDGFQVMAGLKTNTADEVLLVGADTQVEVGDLHEKWRCVPHLASSKRGSQALQDASQIGHLLFGYSSWPLNPVFHSSAPQRPNTPLETV